MNLGLMKIRLVSASGFLLALNCFGRIDEVYPIHLGKRRYTMRLEMG